MLAIEIACAAVLAVYVLCQRERAALLRDAALIALGALLGEDACIRAYGFYQYAPGWHLFVDRVPLMIVLIWPAVVLSARDTARALLGPARAARPLALALLTGALVLFDAALIEPLAVHAGLWSWNVAGIFAVPLVGILGWGLYAAAITLALAARSPLARATAPLAAAVLTHAALLASWWAALRWVLRGTVSPVAGGLTVLAAALPYVAALAARRARLEWRALVPRGVATSFFAVLLARSPDASLAAYALAFTPPHLLLCAQSAGARRRATASPAA